MAIQHPIDLNAIHCMLDSVYYDTKPHRQEVGMLSNRICADEAHVSIDEFVKKVGNRGCAFLPCVVKGGRKSENWRGACIFALDFDGGLSYEAFMQRCQEINILPYFTYETFRSRNRDKFRGVFLCSHFITDEPLWLLIQKAFKKLFPEADKQCWDRTRLFFGGKEVIYQSQNIFAPHRLLAQLFHYMKKQDPKNGARNFKRFVSAAQLDDGVGKYGVSVCSQEDSTFEIQNRKVEGNCEGLYIYKRPLQNPSILSPWNESNSIRFT